MALSGQRFLDYQAQIPIVNDQGGWDIYQTFHLGFPYQNLAVWTQNSTSGQDYGKVNFLHLLYSIFIWQLLVNKARPTIPPAPVRASDAGVIGLG